MNKTDKTIKSESFVSFLFIFIFLFTQCVHAPMVYISLVHRYAVGEPRLTQETPPVVSSSRPPGCVLLLTVRHAGRPRTVRPLPQSGHQEKFHSVTPTILSLFTTLRYPVEREAGRHIRLCMSQGQVRCCRRLFTCLCSHHKRDPLWAVGKQCPGTVKEVFVLQAEHKRLQISSLHSVQHRFFVVVVVI